MFIQDLLVDFDYFFLADCDRLSIWPLCSAVDQVVAEFADQPAPQLDHSHLVDILFHGKVDLRYGVRMQLRRGSDHGNRL